MGVQDESGEVGVFISIDIVFDNEEKIESGKDWFGQVDIIGERELGSVSSVDWISCANNGASGLELSNDSSL